VISYDFRSDHHKDAARNVREWFEGATQSTPTNVELRVGDIFEGIPEQGADRMVLDLPEPWRAIGRATESLSPGGILCCYLPTVPQVSQTVEAMRRGGFGWIQTLEGLVRTWNIDGQSVRPDHRMVAHTGFIIVGRKLATPENSVRY
jgi:tRNA (adenine57-N1/adenine58-N1)-methyltransferase